MDFELKTLFVHTCNLAMVYFGFKVAKSILLHFYELWYYSYIPGLPIMPFIGNALRFAKYDRSDLFAEFLKSMDECKDTGGLVRFFAGFQAIVVVKDSNYVEKVVNQSKLDDKGFEYTLIQPWLKTGLLTSGGEKWRRRRKLITPSFHMDILKDYLTAMNEHSQILIENLKKHDSNEQLCLEPYIKACALDIICDTAMGMNVSSQTGQNIEYVNAIAEMCTVFNERVIKVWLWNDLAYKYSKLYQKQKSSLKILHSFTRKIIDKRALDFQDAVCHNNKRLAFLDMLLSLRFNDPSAMSLDDIQEEVDTFMFEGHDTVSTALKFACFNIATNAHVQKKLHEEIDSVIGNSSRHLTNDDLNKLTYLECALKESLRLFPSVPFVVRTASDNLTLDNYNIRKGCSVYIPIWYLHHSEKYFTEPDKYMPERFLPGASLDRHPYVFIPFSAGKRNCIGQKFAMMELKVVMVYILKNFSIECKQSVSDLKLFNEVVLMCEKKIMFTIKPKSN